MKTKKKIGIWGQLGDGGPIADGQAVRTTIITQEMKARYGEENLMILNTNGWKRHPFSFLFGTVRLLAKCDKIVIFPADNGFKTVVPIYDFFNIFFRHKLYDVVIGGYLPNLLKNKKYYLRMLKKYKALFVQTQNIRNNLEALGLDNIHILSNLKRLPTRDVSEILVNNDKYVKVCTMSRINNSKGIEDAFIAVKMANEQLGGEYIHLDIFGMVALEYKQHFDQLLLQNAAFASYGGVLKFDRTTETLKDYFAMLFPTFYYGEGFPGNVVDAYNAGVPMIATDWLYNKDVIIDNRNGYLVPIKNPAALCQALLRLYNNRNEWIRISKNNIEDAAKYKPEIVLSKYYDLLDKE